jgi:GntR family transcriptional regulator
MTRQPSRPKPQLSEGQGPLYLQIATLIRRRIRTGSWRPGERLPSLDALAKELGVALVTLRQAVGVLEDEGFLWRKQGKGTFVTDDPDKSRWLHLKSDWTSLIRHLEGKEPRLLKVADGDRQPALGPDEGKPAPAYHYMRRVHSVDGVPYAVIDICLDRRCYVKAPKAFDDKMVIPVLETLPGVEIKDVRQTFAFSTADIETASLLGIPVNAPIGEVRRVLIDRNGCAVYVGETLYRGDFVKLEVNLTR